MTKIDELAPPVQAPEPKPGGVREKSPGKSFQAILDKATQQAAEPTEARPATRPGDAMADIAGVRPVMTDQYLPPLHTEGLMRAERTLDQLDHYSKLLGDESKTLREVHQALAAMEEEVGELTKVLDRLDKGDPLFPLLESVAVTATVESIKFNRGDYLPGT